MPRHRLLERAPTADEYALLRREVGWDAVDPAAVEAGLEGALYSVCIESPEGELLGCARVAGDGGIYFYLQDVIVRPPYQGEGLGDRLMGAVMEFVASEAGENSFVGLMAAKGVASFYRRYGFQERPAGRPGMYRMWRAGTC